MKIIIFCGGSGTRMWPMSRKQTPKQFQPLISSRTLFQQTIDRLLLGFSLEDIYVSTGEIYRNEIIKEYPDLPKKNIIVEPEQRDTLACVGYAVSIVNELHPESVVFTMWSDHYIKEEKEFIAALKVAAKMAEEDNVIVNIDAKPTFPNVNLGYMEIGKMIKEIDGFPIYEFMRQIEKPPLEKAKQYARSYKYLWHTGYSVFRTQLMLNLYKKHVPEVFNLLQNLLINRKNHKKVENLYHQIPKTSIDLGIYEKLQGEKIVEIPADLGWNDVGAWNVLKDELAVNGKALVVKGKNVDIGSIDCLIYELNGNKIIATIGCENLIIVDTPDALLVASKFKSQEVKKIVEKLKEDKEEKYL